MACTEISDIKLNGERLVVFSKDGVTRDQSETTAHRVFACMLLITLNGAPNLLGAHNQGKPLVLPGVGLPPKSKQN